MGGMVIGDAGDFYRLRIIRMDDSDAPDLEWRDDILYRQPPAQRVSEFAVWRLEVVAIGDEEVVASLGEYASEREAEERLAEAQEDLDDMTKSDFDSRYIEP